MSRGGVFLTPAQSLERFWSKVDRSGECWLWLGPQGKGGYGRCYFRGAHKYVHRIAYELEIGPIPEGLTLDHLCRNRACVNPAHLEPVTLATNIMRGDTVAARNAAKTHCKRGHELSGDNVKIYKKKGGRYEARVCVACYLLAGKPVVS